MKKLSEMQIENVCGGQKLQCEECGRAVIMGGMLGGLFGGIGGLVGMALVALGPNCLNLGGSKVCANK